MSFFGGFNFCACKYIMNVKANTTNGTIREKTLKVKFIKYLLKIKMATKEAIVKYRAVKKGGLYNQNLCLILSGKIQKMTTLKSK